MTKRNGELSPYTDRVFCIFLEECAETHHVDGRHVLPDSIELPWPETEKERESLDFIMEQIPEHFGGTVRRAVIIHFDSPLCSEKPPPDNGPAVSRDRIRPLHRGPSSNVVDLRLRRRKRL